MKLGLHPPLPRPQRAHFSHGLTGITYMSWKHCHLQCRDSLTFPLRSQPHANKAERFDYVSKWLSSLPFKIPLVCLVSYLNNAWIWCYVRWWSSWKRWPAQSMWALAMQREYSDTWNTILLFCVTWSATLKTSCALAVSSQRRKPVIGIMQLAITSKRKRWFFFVFYVEFQLP